MLYIEDNLPNLQLVQRILDGHPDIELITATEGRLGLELAREHQPALVLLDMHLPRYNGEQILQRLRSTERYAQTPVVVMSSSAAPEEENRAQKHPPLLYFRKPSRFARSVSLLKEPSVMNV